MNAARGESYWTKTETGLEATDDGQQRASQELKGEDWCIFSGGAEGQVSWFKEAKQTTHCLCLCWAVEKGRLWGLAGLGGASIDIRGP
ncbi:hypothetical protein LB503_006532 [Fusarium chuoi]|nr:hypothetical protein LB503_006532 [Fusarium chuoi]